MVSGSLSAFQIVTKTTIEQVGGKMHALTFLEITATIEKPIGNLELQRIVHDGDNLVDLIG